MAEMRWIETNGRPPRNKDTFWHCQFRNGLVSLRPYNGRQMNWSHRDPSDACYPWDVIAVARADEDKPKGGAWTPVSGGY